MSRIEFARAQSPAPDPATIDVPDGNFNAGFAVIAAHGSRARSYAGVVEYIL